MPTYLRQKSTGDLFMFSEQMAKRDDMEMVDLPDIRSGSAPAPAAPTEAVVEIVTPVVTEPVVVEAEVEVVEPVVVEPDVTDATTELDDLFKGLEQ